MMFSHRDEPANSNFRVSSLPTAAYLYLVAEVLVAAVISILLATLALIKCALPKPPRDLTNTTVVVTGAASNLGKAVAEEFIKAGCIVACINQNADSKPKRAVAIYVGQYQKIDELESQNDFYQVLASQKILSYKCDSRSKDDILGVAKKIHREIGHVNVLITGTGDASSNILDTVTMDLMSHYWTMLAFIPSMMHCQHSHVVAVFSTTSTKDAYMASKAAIAGSNNFPEYFLDGIFKKPEDVMSLRTSGLVQSISQHFTNANQLSFTMVAPKAGPRLTRQSEQQTAKDIVEAVRRDQCSLTIWASHVSCTMYKAIASFTQWIYRQIYNID